MQSLKIIKLHINPSHLCAIILNVHFKLFHFVKNLAGFNITPIHSYYCYCQLVLRFPLAKKQTKLTSEYQRSFIQPESSEKLQILIKVAIGFFSRKEASDSPQALVPHKYSNQEAQRALKGPIPLCFVLNVELCVFKFVYDHFTKHDYMRTTQDDRNCKPLHVYLGTNLEQCRLLLRKHGKD